MGFAPRRVSRAERAPRIGALDELAVYRARLQGGLVRKRARFDLIDLFSGAGGMTLGFTEAFGHTFRPVWANDFNGHACRTYDANFGTHCHDGDIVDLLEDDKHPIPHADVVIGGPPCQGFSLLNKNRRGDPRKELWRPYLEVVRRAQASVFVMENVPQLLGSQEHDEIADEARKMGFKLAWTKLLASDYGVPQSRTRAFIIGCKFEDPAKDTLTKERRSECMSRVRGKDTTPELVVRRTLHGMGFRYSLHGKRLPGCPDVVLTGHRKVVFVHGCFWHRHNCPRGTSTPTSNVDVWKEKFARNVERDRAAVGRATPCL